VVESLYMFVHLNAQEYYPRGKIYTYCDPF